MAKCSTHSLVSHAWLAILFVLLPGNAPAQSADESDEALARSIVEKADQVRFPTEPFEVEVDIVTMRQAERIDARKYRVMSKGNENTIVSLLEPASDRGQSMLMKGRDLWVFMPNVSQPVRLSLAQRLSGQVANGDLARANFAGDYTPKILRTETICGGGLLRSRAERGRSRRNLPACRLLGPKIECMAVSGRVLFAVEPIAEDLQVRTLPKSGWANKTYASRNGGCTSAG